LKFRVKESNVVETLFSGWAERLATDKREDVSEFPPDKLISYLAL
jgi:hypothetical protein